MNISNGGSNSQDFDVNIAPIIDCFTVLITFLLASASFLSIGIFDAGMAAGGTESTQQTPPTAQISIELTSAQDARIKVENKNGSSQTTDVKFDALTEKLSGLKASYPDVQGVILLAQTEVEYKTVITAMEGIRKTFPAVTLGGF